MGLYREYLLFRHLDKANQRCLQALGPATATERASLGYGLVSTGLLCWTETAMKDLVCTYTAVLHEFIGQYVLQYMKY